jgi:MFS family permease
MKRTDEYVEGIKQYHDMKIWMILAGGLHIFIAIFLFMAGIGSLLGALIPTESDVASTPLAMAFAGLVFYLCLTAVFLVQGYGTIMCRRWARALGTAGWGLSILWGSIGVFSFFLLLSEMPKLLQNTPAPAGGPPIQKIMTLVLLIMGVFYSILFVGVPLVFFFFFKSRHVKMTCEHHDSRPRWTDAVPVPVLTVIVFLASFLSSITMIPFYGFTMPFFGIFLRGWQGLILFILCIVLIVYLIFILYRMKPYSWICTLIAGFGATLSFILTIFNSDFSKLYEQMGYPEEQIELMQKIDMVPTMSISLVFTFLVFAIYMFWIRKYFKGGIKDSGTESSVAQ